MSTFDVRLDFRKVRLDFRKILYACVKYLRVVARKCELFGKWSCLFPSLLTQATHCRVRQTCKPKTSIPVLWVCLKHVDLLKFASTFDSHVTFAHILALAYCTNLHNCFSRIVAHTLLCPTQPDFEWFFRIRLHFTCEVAIAKIALQRLYFCSDEVLFDQVSSRC